jgi:hypothetical protein
MVEKKFVKEDFVGVLQSAQINVSLQVVIFSLVGLVSTNDLLLKGLDVRWEKPVQAKFASFLFREGRAFVQVLAVQEIHPARAFWQTWLFYRLLLHSHFRFSFLFFWLRTLPRPSGGDSPLPDRLFVAAAAENCSVHEEPEM